MVEDWLENANKKRPACWTSGAFAMMEETHAPGAANPGPTLMPRVVAQLMNNKLTCNGVARCDKGDGRGWSDHVLLGSYLEQARLSLDRPQYYEGFFG